MSEPASQLSARLFYRIYAAVVICIVVVGTAVDYLANQTSESDRLTDFRHQARPLFAVINHRLQALPRDERSVEVQRLSERMSREAQVFEFEDFSVDPDFHHELQTGQLVPLFDADDELTFYQHIPESDQVLAVAMPGYNAAARNQFWVVTVFYALVALSILILLRPFARDLLKLKTAAARLGQDDFSARIEVSDTSSLESVLQAFNRMAEHIEHLVTSQRDLTNSVSHELRTPLARLKFAFEELESESPGLAPKIDAMRTDVGELEALIDEMLCYAEINQIQDLSAIAAPLGPILREAVDAEQRAGIEIIPPASDSALADLHIECDAHHLLRAFRNVVRNSVRFARSRCQVSVQLDPAALTVDVDDDGPGIPVEHRPRIFEPFYKADRVDSGGFGLGLSIAQSVMHKHHGDLMLVDSQLGGTCFRFRFPRSVVC